MHVDGLALMISLLFASDSREGRRSGHKAIGDFLQQMQNDRSELNDLTLKLQDKEIQVTVCYFIKK